MFVLPIASLLVTYYSKGIDSQKIFDNKKYQKELILKNYLI